MPNHRRKLAAGHAGLAALTLGALGVVFGDIGTSPLYALQTVFHAHNQAVKPDQAAVYGIISLVFWSITSIVSVKYVTFIMRADNEGEGGIMALIARVMDVPLTRRAAKAMLVALGIFGAALFYGDGMITPAISVLGAVEGLGEQSAALKELIVPITVGILIALFFVQRYGTGRIGRVFGWIMMIWFVSIAIAGIPYIIKQPHVFLAVNPSHVFPRVNVLRSSWHFGLLDPRWLDRRCGVLGDNLSKPR